MRIGFIFTTAGLHIGFTKSNTQLPIPLAALKYNRSLTVAARKRAKPSRDSQGAAAGTSLNCESE
jgi:hypothetical protein